MEAPELQQNAEESDMMEDDMSSKGAASSLTCDFLTAILYLRRSHAEQGARQVGSQ